MNSDIKVSIICNAYNHEKYIRDALDGFLMQKTNFRFEVLVHDDASTDRTAEIIREYEKKYPEIIKPIYQIENKHSQKIPIMKTFQYPRVQGKYIALCEGDDYWTDGNKLQKQYDAMEAHPEVDMCAHKAKVVNADNGKFISYMSPSDADCVLATRAVIAGGGAYVATASLFFRTDILKRQLPVFFQKWGFDYPIQIYGSLRGGIIYIGDCMSAYRYMTESSWTKKTMGDNSRRIESWEKNISVLEQVNIDTDHKYNDVIEKCILRSKFKILKLKKDYTAITKGECSKMYKEMSLKRKCIFQIERYLPGLYELYLKYRHKGH